jgi:DNA invertase Pin-like site-specific DNA recombinase
VSPSWTAWSALSPTARAKADQIRKLAVEGAKRQDIAVQLGIGVASVYRVLKES